MMSELLLVGDTGDQTLGSTVVLLLVGTYTLSYKYCTVQQKWPRCWSQAVDWSIAETLVLPNQVSLLLFDYGLILRGKKLIADKCLPWRPLFTSLVKYYQVGMGTRSELQRITTQHWAIATCPMLTQQGFTVLYGHSQTIIVELPCLKPSTQSIYIPSRSIGLSFLKRKTPRRSVFGKEANVGNKAES